MRRALRCGEGGVASVCFVLLANYCQVFAFVLFETHAEDGALSAGALGARESGICRERGQVEICEGGVEMLAKSLKKSTPRRWSAQETVGKQ